MFRSEHVRVHLQNDSLLNNIRRAIRFGVRTLGKGGSPLGGYAVLPLDAPAAVLPTKHDFVYGDVLDRVLAQQSLYAELLDRLEQPFKDAAQSINRAERDARKPFWSNTYFQGNDARIAWGLTALTQPRRIVEIGSGNSTKFFRHAIDHNSTGTRLICIDPTPRAEISGIADEIYNKPVQEVDPKLFSALQPGDILFFDGSHLVVQGSDTQFVFLEILPKLPKGVLVHVHDINLPYEYRSFYSSRLYGEQYMLGALLVFAADWKPVLPVYWLEETGRLERLDNPGASFWITNDTDFLMRRIGASNWAA